MRAHTIAALLLAPCLSAQDADFAARLKALDTETSEAREKNPQADLSKFAGRYLELAKQCEGTDVSRQALQKVITCSSMKTRDLAQDAAITLVANHVDSEDLAEFAERLFIYERVLGDEYDSIVEQLIMDGAPNVRGWLTYNAHRAALGEGTDTSSGTFKTARSAVLETLETIDDAKLRGVINGRIAFHEKLLPGKIAPEIEAEDIDGVKFKLSDYRGKVVMLDFWGDW